MSACEGGDRETSGPCSRIPASLPPYGGVRVSCAAPEARALRLSSGHPRTGAARSAALERRVPSICGTGALQLRSCGPNGETLAPRGSTASLGARITGLQWWRSRPKQCLSTMRSWVTQSSQRRSPQDASSEPSAAERGSWPTERTAGHRNHPLLDPLDSASTGRSRPRTAVAAQARAPRRSRGGEASWPSAAVRPALLASRLVRRSPRLGFVLANALPASTPVGRLPFGSPWARAGGRPLGRSAKIPPAVSGTPDDACSAASGGPDSQRVGSSCPATSSRFLGRSLPMRMLWRGRTRSSSMARHAECSCLGHAGLGWRERGPSSGTAVHSPPQGVLAVPFWRCPGSRMYLRLRLGPPSWPSCCWIAQRGETAVTPRARNEERLAFRPASPATQAAWCSLHSVRPGSAPMRSGDRSRKDLRGLLSGDGRSTGER